MGLDEREKPFVFLGLSEKLERDAARADRLDHSCHFDRGFIFGNDNFQIKNVVDMDVRAALDDAPTQGKIHHGAFAPHFSA